MSALLKFSHDDPSVKWMEEHIQMAIVEFLFQRELEQDFTFAGDMGGMAASSKSVAARAKLCGMRKGECDIRLYLPYGKLVSVEVKTVNGVVSKDQEIRHAKLRTLGFEVHVAWFETPADGVAWFAKMLDSFL